MSEGLTYDTKSQAESTAEALRIAGEEVIVVPVAGGQWRVYKTGKAEEQRLGEAITQEKKKAVEWGEFEEEIELGEEKEAYKERRPKATKKKKLEVDLEQAKATLERTNQAREKMGLEPGKIVALHDPETYKVTGYTIEYPPAAEDIRKGLITAAKGEFETPEAEATIRKIGGVKGRLKQQARATTQRVPEPKAIIAGLPARDTGAIGMERPAIGTTGIGVKSSRIAEIGKPGVKEANNLGVKARGFGTPPSEPPLKSSPKTQRISVSRTKDAGFADIPILRRKQKDEDTETVT